jgi:alpha-N-arabinofuranosidase
MDYFIESVISTVDAVKAKRQTSKSINLSFDEWNVWYQHRFETVEKISGIDNWPEAPRLLEDVYTVADAVVVGSLLISLLKHADSVKSASLAQLVNVIAPIMTEPGGPAWRQTIFHPFAITSRLGRGQALRAEVTGPSIATTRFGDVPAVDAVVTHDAEAGAAAVFLVNRSRTEAITVDVDLYGFGALTIAEATTLTDDDPDAANTIDDQDRVVPAANDSAELTDGALRITLPPVSWTAVGLTAQA